MEIENRIYTSDKTNRSFFFFFFSNANNDNEIDTFTNSVIHSRSQNRTLCFMLFSIKTK